MSSRALLGTVLVVVGLVGSSAMAAGGVAAAAAPLASNPVTGNVSGPTTLPIGGNGTYYISGNGGPAVANGVLVGKLSYTAKLSADNLSGASVTPTNGSLTPNTSASVVLTVGNISETVTLDVEITSTAGSSTATTNLTYAVTVRTPYTVRATLVAGATAVRPFTVVVSLDGTRVGNLTVPALAPNQTYDLAYRYAGATPGPGWHTFVLAVPNEHGLVTFANGQTSFSATFYVAPPTPNNSIWYVAGVVAFFGALFIFGTRVAARRRGAGRR